jgi:hypothetical protein
LAGGTVTGVVDGGGTAVVGVVVVGGGNVVVGIVPTARSSGMRAGVEPHAAKTAREMKMRLVRTNLSDLRFWPAKRPQTERGENIGEVWWGG